MAGDLQRDGVKFCRSIFDTVRKMSADGLGVTRQGYSSTESEVLDYLKMIGQELGLEINTDLAGNVWMCLPGKNRELPAFVAGRVVDEPYGFRARTRLHDSDDALRGIELFRQGLCGFAGTHRKTDAC